MTDRRITRREFMKDSAVVATGVAAAVGAARGAQNAAAVRKTRSYHAQMEYRRLGKTGLWVSAACLGGHWKRVDKVIRAKGRIGGWTKPGSSSDADRFHKNRWDVVTRCLEVGINYVDACSGPEILTYARALKGRREKMYLGYSWHVRESRFPPWRSAKKLLAGLDQGLKEAGLAYCDLWRISALTRGSGHTRAEVEEMVKALETARKQGKCRFTGVSSHDRPWLKGIIEKYPDVIQVVLTPYTADSKVLPKDSLFEAVRKHDVGVFGIKPFASNSLFQGDGSPDSPHAEADDRRARLAIRYILANPAVTAPIPGLISGHQVDNVVAAIRERRRLDRAEKAELRRATTEMWARLPEGYRWLKDWRYV
jgi:predicted aldo/keto reductase-like oxidoreductase